MGMEASKDVINETKSGHERRRQNCLINHQATIGDLESRTKCTLYRYISYNEDLWRASNMRALLVEHVDGLSLPASDLCEMAGIEKCKK